MKMLVLGAGLQGSACAYDLLQHKDVQEVRLADIRISDLPPFLLGSLTCSQIWRGLFPIHAISRGARCQSGAPGTRA